MVTRLATAAGAVAMEFDLPANPTALAYSVALVGVVALMLAAIYLLASRSRPGPDRL